jgi:hypothetical protein
LTSLLLLFWDDTKFSNLVVVEIWASLSIICRKISKRYLESIKKKIKHEFESYLHKSSAEEAIMIHETIVSQNKQLVESIASIETEFSNRSMKDNRRASIIFIEIFEDKFENAKIFYHVRNIDQLKYWLKKDENALIKTWVNIRDESILVMNEYNKKIVRFEEFTNEYNNYINDLNDFKLIIRELKMKMREKNLRDFNNLLFIIEDEIIVFTATFKKLFDSSNFTDDKNLIIDDWLSVMQTSWKKTRIDFLLTFNKKHT